MASSMGDGSSGGNKREHVGELDHHEQADPTFLSHARRGHIPVGLLRPRIPWLCRAAPYPPLFTNYCKRLSRRCGFALRRSWWCGWLRGAYPRKCLPDRVPYLFGLNASRTNAFADGRRPCPQKIRPERDKLPAPGRDLPSSWWTLAC
jgi:hypothetical protein